MNLKLKDKPLSFQIWIILGIILGGTAVIIAITTPFVLRSSFTRESYARLEDAQEYLINYGNIREELFNFTPSLPKEDNMKEPSFRIVRHALLSKEGVMIGSNTPIEYGEIFIKQAVSQEVETENYQEELDKRHLFYRIREVEIGGSTYYLVSYITSMYRDNLVKIIFGSLIRILIIISVVTWIASILLARYLSRPLKDLESKVKNIANKKWDS